MFLVSVNFPPLPGPAHFLARVVFRRIEVGALINYPDCQPFTADELARWKAQAMQVTIIRDNWGIPHVYGQTDADAVFGLLYAQCEDDFARVEANYIEKLGRQAELKGREALFEGLLHRIVLDSAAAKKDLESDPPRPAATPPKEGIVVTAFGESLGKVEALRQQERLICRIIKGTQGNLSPVGNGRVRILVSFIGSLISIN